MMKLTVLSMILALTLMSNTCGRHSDGDHYDIIIKNNSADSVYVAYKSYNVSKCALQGRITRKDESYIDHSSRSSWEHTLKYQKTYEVYIVDPKSFNNPIKFYDCDSIKDKNLILKHYKLSLQELKDSNFIINYR